MGIGGCLFYLFFDMLSIGGVSFKILITSEELLSTLKYYMFCINSILLGAGIFILVQYRKGAHDISSYMAELSKPTQLNPPNLFSYSSVLIALSIIPAVSLVIGSGFNIFYDTQYLEYKIRIFRIIGQMFIPVSGILLGYALPQRVNINQKIAIVLSILFNFIVLVSIATRLIAVFPVFVSFGYMTSRGSYRYLPLFLIISLSMFFIPLYLRSQEQHGFIPYVYALFRLNTENVWSVFLLIFNNIFFSVPLTYAALCLDVNYPWNYLFTSLNPLPGFLTNWYQILPDIVRLNATTPVNSISEIFYYGHDIAFLFFVILGFMIMYLTLITKRIIIVERNLLVYSIIISMIFLFSIYSLQYPLRNSLRYFYYTLLFVWLYTTLYKQFRKLLTVYH